MGRFIVLLLGLLMILTFYYMIGWFILNEQNAFLWPWWVKIIYLILSLGSWGNFTDGIDKE